VNVGGMPMLYHIMQIYSKQGHRDFIIATGHLGHMIEKWVNTNWDFLVRPDGVADDINVVDTGKETQTGGRLMRLADYLPEPFFWTYGDGVGNVNLKSLEAAHNLLKHTNYDILMTLTAVHPPARFGEMVIEDSWVVEFGEKKRVRNTYINGGFYLAEPAILEIVPDDDCQFEFDIMPLMARQRKLGASYHNGYWQMVDNPRDLELLNETYAESDTPPWLEGLRK
jgi:glucose-1-phosphate cytidylyltransferase